MFYWSAVLLGHFQARLRQLVELRLDAGSRVLLHVAIHLQRQQPALLAQGMRLIVDPIDRLHQVQL